MTKDDNNNLRRQRSINRQDIPEPELTNPTLGLNMGSDPTTPTLLLCGECEVVYEDRDHWNNCPRCGDELREVEKA